jgi:hypothetical protein
MTLLLAIAAVVLAAPAPEMPAIATTAPDAAPPQIALYPDRFFRGPVQRFTSDQPRIDPPLEPQSVRISGRWEICPEADFKGDCIEVDRDYAVAAGLDGGFRLRSLRQLSAGAGAANPAAGVLPGGASLGGVASRYWPEPTYGNERVLACPAGKSNLNCAHDTAENLCRRAGFRQVRYWQLQTIAGRSYLADVLCVRSDDK